MTNVGDTQYLFLDERHPDDPRLFLYDDEWYEAKINTEEIKVRFRFEPETIELVETLKGFLISEDSLIRLRWSPHDTEEGFDALTGMNFARNLKSPMNRGKVKFKMKILVFDAGVIGSLYAAMLKEAGHDVTMLTRGQR